jgi:3-methyl-2-oxobutanoate hydroxymethyltransferase
VLVLHDLVGLFERFIPKFVKRYAECGKTIKEAVAEFCSEVRDGTFPGHEHQFEL